MKVIRTVSGIEFDEAWDGISTIDFALRIAIKNSNLATVFATFSNPEETETLTRIWGGVESVYTGYSEFKGVLENAAGEIIVTLTRKVITV